MAARITDKKRKQIVADYVQCQNYSEVARKYGLSVNGVKKIVQEDPARADAFKQKSIEDTADVIAYMDSKKHRVKTVLGKLLDAMESKVDNLDMFTGLKDIATAYGILVDKEFKRMEIMGVHTTETTEDDPLSESLKELAGEIDAD